jgi:hypothetical protein
MRAKSGNLPSRILFSDCVAVLPHPITRFFVRFEMSLNGPIIPSLPRAMEVEQVKQVLGKKWEEIFGQSLS